MEENLPPGFRFHPTDEELISYYLGSKVCDSKFKSRAVADVDLNKCEPWDLPAKASMGEKEWYFFSLRDRKYPTGLRTNRATEAGYWKTTGKDKEILSGDLCVGMKKTLVFYKGRAPKGHKTNWVMHEYRLQNYNPTKEEWVVCRVFEKSSTAKKNFNQQQQPISPEIMLTEEQANDLFSTTNNNTTPTNYIDSNYNEYIEEEDESYNNPMMMGWSTTGAAAAATNYVSNINSLLLTALQLRAGGYHQYRPTSFDVNYVFDNLQASTSNPVLPPPPMDQPFNQYLTNNGE